ncbi:MAG: polysaccharide biosynthesis C-terminal domain-containing protein [Caldilineaceae bacterium]
MLSASGPLIDQPPALHHLLAHRRVDSASYGGAAAVGLYSVGVKYLDGLNIIPSIFTMAVFPLMSRYARNNNENLLRSYILSVRLLIMMSLPIAMMVTFLAQPLVWLVGGSEFINLPETVYFFGRAITFTGGANLALQLVIWSIPIGFVNSVTQYVLIAVNQQRYLTKAFIIGVIFNTVGNLLVIPSFGYLGAAVVTILSEFSLLFPFYYSVKRHVGTVPWLSLCLTPAVSAVVMGAAIYVLILFGVNVWLAALLGWLVYAVALALTGALGGEDMAIVWRALPLGPLKKVLPAQG